jgi:hypothetical protein
MRLKKDCQTCTKRHHACQDTCEVMKHNKQYYNTIKKEKYKNNPRNYIEYKKDILAKNRKERN